MKKWLIGIGVAIVVLGIVVFAGYKWLMFQIHGSTAEKDFQVMIEEGATLKDVLKKLEDENMLGNANYRSLYMRFYEADYTYQAGEYEIKRGMTLEQTLAKFQKGEVVKPKTVKVTIPEGWNVKQIARRLAENNLGDEKKYMQLFSDRSYYFKKQKEFAFLPPLKKRTKYPFEGYLFPATYEFVRDAKEEDIIERMLQQMQVVVDKLAEQYPQVQSNTLRVFTLASIIEKETAVVKERPRVAGVFANRLKVGQILQSDATVEYAHGKYLKKVLYKHLEIDDLYNTYRYEGLPPGPIAAPSLSALTAAVAPEKHNYYYFVTKKDGSRTHYFAETLAEHESNIAKSEQTGKE